jgi:S-formylglutathione hydrolase FrmB
MKVAAAVAACVAVAIGAVAVKARIDETGRGYSHTHGATVAHYTLSSRLLGRKLAEIGVVPSGRGRRPLLVLLHGRHDPSLAWLVPSTSGPESVLSDALFAGLARLGGRAPVVVLLNGGGHSYYHDRADGRWASMILEEAIPDATRRFRTIPGRIAVGGISMGGYGALHLAALRPHEFCAAGGHSAALWQASGDSAPGAFDDAADFVRNDVFAAARRGRFAGLPVWMDGGSSDPFRTSDAAFVALLRSRHVRVDYHVWPGGHTSSYWNAHMASYLAFYASELRSCRRR